MHQMENDSYLAFKDICEKGGRSKYNKDDPISYPTLRAVEDFLLGPINIQDVSTSLKK